MPIWSASNGYLGAGTVAALVEADSEVEARILATEALAEKRDADGYDEDYAEIVRIVRVEFPYVGDTLP